MKFEHLIQINDPLNSLIDPLSIAQVWHGLVLRARQSTLFVPHLDECRILASWPDGFSRSLRYGQLVIEDRVELTPPLQVLYLVKAQLDIPASSLRMRIEQGQPEMLFVRFEYDDGHSAAEDAANEMYNSFRRSAYQESDRDTVRIIRQLAAENRLDHLPDD